ncbi:MAG: hypothetical protein DME16_11870 [Candidatus Rokuibacteriota bacterium]|nr:MAG: hypothetical protein DME16_11870 [Candidatus Rokubacteria bacterium]
MTVEATYGVPTVAMHTDKFDRVVRSVATVNGMPGLRQAFVPQPIMGKTAAQLRAYIDGTDPITGRPVMQEVIEGLTQPFNEGDLGPVEFDRSTPRLVEPDAAENLERLFLENRWTDMLPIVLPTEERVPASCVTARGSSSSAVAGMSFVNGPIRDEIGMNSGTGALGPYNHANATIGRAYGLLSQNLQGGSIPGLSYMGNQGNNYNYNSLTFAENEERSPWEPFHVQHGFQPTDSAVSVFSSCRATAFTLGLREKHWREHCANMLRGMDPHTPPVLLLDPIAARQFIDRGGFTKKDALIDWLYGTAKMSASEYWDYQLIQNYIYPRATFGEEPWASKLKAAPDELIPMFRREDIHVVVVGGETNGYWRIMGANYQKTVSIDEWR